MVDFSNPDANEWCKNIIKNNMLTDLNLFANFVYDPTNGTTSPGEIFRPGGTPVGVTGRIARFLETSGG